MEFGGLRQVRSREKLPLRWIAHDRIVAGTTRQLLCMSRSEPIWNSGSRVRSGCWRRATLVFRAALKGGSSVDDLINSAKCKTAREASRSAGVSGMSSVRQWGWFSGRVRVVLSFGPCPTAPHDGTTATRPSGHRGRSHSQQSPYGGVLTHVAWFGHLMAAEGRFSNPNNATRATQL